jgi:hypothetical protein
MIKGVITMEKETNEHLKKFYFGAANHVYNSDDYNMTDEFLQGLSATHQQVSDCYSDGTIESGADKEL